jgi:predicted RNA binding protein YcfA (HicA-like mRNA interferase family)
MGRKEHSAATRDLLRQLKNDGWYEARKGPGDHVQFRHPDKTGRVTLDKGAREQTTSTLRSIYRQAGWEW